MITLVVLISGRGSNMEAILAAAQTGYLRGAKPELVISDNADAAGLKIAKQKFGVPTRILPNNESRGWDYDSQIANLLDRHTISSSSVLICLAGFMKILSRQFVEKYKMRILNIHPSLLPSFPGLHAQKQALDYGVKVSGCTVHLVDEAIDSGPILFQKAVRVLNSDTVESLSARILKWEHILYPYAIKRFTEGKIRIHEHGVLS